MKRFLLALALATLPTAALTGLTCPVFAASTLTELGDLSNLHGIVADTQALAGRADMVGAAARITDFETAWDADAGRLRALNADKWGVIDDASDAALAALRAPTPLAGEVDATLSQLLAALDDPGAMPVQRGAVTAVTDANGRPLPCEDLLGQVRAAAAAAATPMGDTDQASFDDLQGKGIERCNADDDKRADDFFAQALALMGK